MRPSRFVALVAAVAAVAVAPAALANPSTNTKTPIKHVIFLMQENHSFDNYFGTYPGANGIPAGTCMPIYPGSKTNHACIKPFSIGNRPATDLAHNIQTFQHEYRGGKMDGFVSTYRRLGITTNLSMGHYVESDLPYYWNIAKNYVLFDRFFTSAAAGSIWNHLFWVTATPGNPKYDTLPTTKDGFGNLPTIFDRLQAKHISWKFYVQNYDPRITYRSDVLGDRGSQVVWVPLLDYARYIDNPELHKHIVDMSQYYKDLKNGTLPAVSYMVPSGSSEHPPGRIQAGERFVRSLITELMRSSSWNSSAFIWSYDDWGGWFDHVKPPRVDAYGYGFRAPALLVSPYARKGFVDDTTLDFTSVLKFIEQNWTLKPLAHRDATANSIAGAFNFAAPPRQAQLLAADFVPPVLHRPSRSALYPSYAIALSVAIAAAAWAAWATRRRRRGSGPAGAEVEAV
jgi:phospholipase C